MVHACKCFNFPGGNIMISRLFLALNAIAIGLIALAYLYDPNLLLARYGLETDSPGMDNMLRSTYGGLYLVLAALFATGVFVAKRRRDALIFLLLFMGGNAIGRTASIVFAGMPPQSIMPLLAYEVVVAVVAGILAVRSQSRDKQGVQSGQ